MPSGFSYNLKRLRKQTRLTQEELAAKTNVSVATIRNYESGRSYPSNETIERLSDSLGFTPNILEGTPLIRYSEDDFKRFSTRLDELQGDPYAVRLFILEHIYLIDTKLLIEFVKKLMNLDILLNLDDLMK